jgi:hypothetical protein
MSEDYKRQDSGDQYKHLEREFIWPANLLIQDSRYRA